jgi:hypothetical protein
MSATENDLRAALDALLTSSGARGRYHAFEHADAVAKAELLLAAKPEVAAMRYIEILRADEGDTVTILCDDPEAWTNDKRLAVECNGGWTDWRNVRFYGESVVQCVAKAVCARETADLSNGVIMGSTLPPPGKRWDWGGGRLSHVRQPDTF